ncbi:MAG: DUF924 domain-containing protein [Betaproteobacteria bacterium]|nr:DUF924 domain-containing protein [Betaproteobacteria bacterium]
MDNRVEEILDFWFGVGIERGSPRKAWFSKDKEFDDSIRTRFLATYEEAAAGKLAGWQERGVECLALVVLLDQFPRNMFRNSGRAFAADELAIEAARYAITRGFDRVMRPVERQFLYLPFEHSETLQDQMLSCELMSQLKVFPETADVHRWAVKHLEIIQRFGRFPHRNASLGRASSPDEEEFLKQPGAGF